MSDQAGDPNLTVLIVGAGLGGLMLGAILESANISYHILERSTEFRPLGSVISLTGDIFPVFEQLGIFDELRDISLPVISTDMFDIKLDALGSLPAKHLKIACGYDTLILARPNISNLLRQKVPAHKVSLGKKVIRTKEHNNRVSVYCSDDTEYECNILVGADGAYSAVRQNMFKDLEEEDKLPLNDKDAFSICYINMVGISTPENPENYSQLSDKTRTHSSVVMGNDNDSCYAVTVPGNQICWGIQIQLPEGEAKKQYFTNSEWGPESVDGMLKQYQDFPCAFGGTMKELMDSTPKNLISKVFLEEKVFETWYHGRSVLIGDGAAVAMKDAVVLANCIYNMRDKTGGSIRAAFASYYRQRHLEADELANNSAFHTSIMSGHRNMVQEISSHKKEGKKLNGKRMKPNVMRPTYILTPDFDI
ncbi:hypothetical protein BGZ80_004833 [Entomortierella chlamydospora]|uniref:FAD-binding domain-containing protein n=1 Tax=Entomortierella chlamydospora TaxID=101097 RepID=A0A9P6T2H1_9FUNG|nr:hypothetical protein BGZ79_007337 [Entomortierella chlamydospora]KAG0020069.1 hypothetical protein BGZ80_004833 [Entomortierella chlamydospora]